MNEQEAAELLRVDPDATEERIEKQYRERTKEVHPDQGGSAELFKLVREARDALLAGSEERTTTDSSSGAEPGRPRGRTQAEGGSGKRRRTRTRTRTRAGARANSSGQSGPTGANGGASRRSHAAGAGSTGRRSSSGSSAEQSSTRARGGFVDWVGLLAGLFRGRATVLPLAEGFLVWLSITAAENPLMPDAWGAVALFIFGQFVLFLWIAGYPYVAAAEGLVIYATVAGTEPVHVVGTTAFFFAAQLWICCTCCARFYDYVQSRRRL